MSSAEPPTTLWQRDEEIKRGPRPSFTLDDIADNCVRIADADGLSALSMRRVGDRLGTGAASLYRYVSGKQDLISLMCDRVAAESGFAPLTGDIRTDVHASAGRARDTHRGHPWLGLVTPERIGPNAIRYLDHMAGALAPAGLTPAATMMGVAMITGWIKSFAAQENSAAAGATVGVTGADLATLLPLGNYPHLSQLFTDRFPDDPVDNDTSFRTGIDTLLFGIAPAR
ncbi:TetR/AcrR family transcriptional regulator [Nocardia callitridis]|uniref:TetR/AcrR family transcriptional regulator C-terminal domain-containing protein n=1 Tax=Nocardia callitridis TaxID=648753 RepID=A0ABP9JWV5_9NOCA